MYCLLEVRKRVKQFHPIQIGDFDFDSFKTSILRFMQAMQVDESGVCYKYSAKCKKPTLYASVYACMTLGMLGELRNYRDEDKKKWIEYFDSFQDPETGLFYDPVVANDIYNDSDWWGARHLALHMISSYAHLGGAPRCPFKFLTQYYKSGAIIKWLEKYDWSGYFDHSIDVDNKIMNVGCLLQYQRDTYNDGEAVKAINELKQFLKYQINHTNGMWGEADLTNMHQRSRLVQFAYHVLPIFFYDEDYKFDAEKIVKITLATQNCFGGFGVQANSSACEDIDSLYILIKLYPYVSLASREKIDDALNRVFSWLLINQMDDGGFVFRLNEKLEYGHKEMLSFSNEGAMFPTWFRVLSISYTLHHFSKKRFILHSLPGIEQSLCNE